MQAKTLFLAAVLIASQALAEDNRQLATLPPAAQEALREEMQGNLLAINEILTLMAAGKVKEAGQLAETSLGKSAQGKHRDKPFNARPGPHSSASTPSTFTPFITAIRRAFGKASARGPTTGASSTYDSVKPNFSSGASQGAEPCCCNSAMVTMRTALSARAEANCAAISR